MDQKEIENISEVISQVQITQTKLNPNVLDIQASYGYDTVGRKPEELFIRFSCNGAIDVTWGCKSSKLPQD